MNQDLTRVYTGADLSGATGGVIYLPVVRDSTLEKVSVRTDAAQSGAAVFEVRKNGSVITGLSALTIANAAKVGSVTGLSVALADGDEIALNLLSGNVSSPITLNLGVEDGQSAGGTGGGAVHSLDAKPHTYLFPKSDYFDDEIETTTKWTDFQGANFEWFLENKRLNILSKSNPAGRFCGKIQPLPAGDCTLICKVTPPNPNVDATAMGLALMQDAVLNPNTSDLGFFGIYNDSNAANYRIISTKFSDYQTYAANIFSEVNLALTTVGFLYFRLSRSGATWSVSYSLDGRIWTAVGTVSESSLFTPKEFGVLAFNNNTGAVYNFPFEFVYVSDAGGAKLPGGTGATASPLSRFTFVGDSITRGQGANLLDAFPHQFAKLRGGASVSFDNQVLRSLSPARTALVLNKGRDGYTTQNVIDNVLPNVLTLRDSTIASDKAIVALGSNDLIQGASAASAYAKLTTIINDLQSAGYETIALTMLDRNDGSGDFDTRRAAYNSLITANSAGADLVIDIAADSRLSDASNATYFQSDTIHPTAAGLAVIAELVDAAI